jgi:hypothetical protein
MSLRPQINELLRVDKINRWHNDLYHTTGHTHIDAVHPFTQMTEDFYEYRYEQRAAEYTLRRWHNGEQQFDRGHEDHIPDWLKRIIDTAKVAGVIRTVKTPPPDIILWFRTDKKHNLIEFIEMK